VLELVVRSAARFCEADDVSIFELDGQDMRMAAHWGSVPHLEILEIGFRFPCTRGSVAGRTVLDRKPVHVIDLQAEAEDFPEGSALARRLGHRTTAGVPLLREGVSIGTLQLRRTEANPFTDKQMVLLGTFADQAVIAIENARLLNELRQRTNDLSEALEQQTATSDVLGVISRSPGELQAVFDIILKNANRLCDAKFSALFIYENGLIRVPSHVDLPPELAEHFHKRNDQPPISGTAIETLIKTKRLIHIRDQRESPEGLSSPAATLAGARTYLAVPLLKDGNVIGAIAIFRQEVRPFADKQIELVQNFASQTVIAIGNARLLSELRESYRVVQQQAGKLEEQSQELLELNQQLERRVADQIGEIERMSKLRRFLPPQVADLIVASGTEKQLESHRREITALFCDLRGFTGFSESSDPEDVMALLREYHAAIGEIIIKYSGTLERYAGDGVMVIFNDPVPVENPALQAVLMALDMRTAIGTLIEKWRDLGHDLGFGIGIAHGFATLGTIGFEGRFDYAAIGTVSNVASRLCDEAKPGQILISPRVRQAVEKAVTVEPVGEFTLKGIRRPMMTYNVLEALSFKPN
jgi:class 3 adenylate cyclase